MTEALPILRSPASYVPCTLSSHLPLPPAIFLCFSFQWKHPQPVIFVATPPVMTTAVATVSPIIIYPATVLASATLETTLGYRSDDNIIIPRELHS